MTDLSKTYLYRMMHIDNVPHVLEHGITHVASPGANAAYVPIGDGSLITRRNSFILNNRRRLGDYIPFYFGARTPMLYVMQNGYNGVAPTPAGSIVYCVSSVQKILDYGLDFVFTNGHAVDGFTKQYGSEAVGEMDTLLDWDAIKAKFWKSETDLDLKRRKEAEFLVHGDIPRSAVLGFVVYNEEAKQQLLNSGVPEKQIHINPNYYY